MAALQEQAGKIWHVSNIMTNEPALKLGQYLCEHTFAEKVFFANSGPRRMRRRSSWARRYSWGIITGKGGMGLLPLMAVFMGGRCLPWRLVVSRSIWMVPAGAGGDSACAVQ